MEINRASRDAVLRTLQPLFEAAARDGLYFHNRARDIWFTALQLRREQHHGRFLWAACHWELRSAAEYMRHLERKVIEDKAKLRQVQADLIGVKLPDPVNFR